MSTFTYESKYGTYKDSFFRVGHYENDNTAIEIWSNSEGPITKVTVNPDINVPKDMIAVKDYSENEGMVDWLMSMDIIEGEPLKIVNTGWITIPIYKLSAHGKEMLGI